MSSVSDAHLIDNGHIKERSGESLKRKTKLEDNEEFIVADGKLKEKEKDKYKRTKLEKIESREERNDTD